jgi:hypothetical protein
MKESSLIEATAYADVATNEEPARSLDNSIAHFLTD